MLPKFSLKAKIVDKPAGRQGQGEASPHVRSTPLQDGRHVCVLSLRDSRPPEHAAGGEVCSQRDLSPAPITLSSPGLLETERVRRGALTHGQSWLQAPTARASAPSTPLGTGETSPSLGGAQPQPTHSNASAAATAPHPFPLAARTLLWGHRRQKPPPVSLHQDEGRSSTAHLTPRPSDAPLHHLLGSEHPRCCLAKHYPCKARHLLLHPTSTFLSLIPRRPH